MPHPLHRVDEALLTRLRAICLELPGAQEKISHGAPVFYTRKIFAHYGASKKGERQSDEVRHSVVVLPDSDERVSLLQEGGRFFEPAYLGAYGWVGLNLRLGPPDWTEVAELVEMSYRNTAGARLVAELDRR